jgi:hypothetical protein
MTLLHSTYNTTMEKKPKLSASKDQAPYQNSR